jgi:hypothetical protein
MMRYRCVTYLTAVLAAGFFLKNAASEPPVAKNGTRVVDTTSASKPALTCDTLARRILDTFERLDQSLQGKFEYVIDIPNDAALGKRRLLLEWADQREKYRITSTETDIKSGKQIVHLTWAWNGSVGRVLFPDVEAGTQHIDFARFQTEHSARNPRGFSLYYRPLGESIRLEGGSLTAVEGRLNDRVVVFLKQQTSYRQLEFILDPSDNFVPISIVATLNQKNQRQSVTTILDHITTPGGNWFIMRSETQHLASEAQSVEFTAKDVSFTAIPEDFFSLKFPDRTLVDDASSGARFIAGGTVPQSDYVEHVIEKSIASMGVESATQDSTSGKKAGLPAAQLAGASSKIDQPVPWLIAVYTFAALLVVTLVVAVVRKKRMAGAKNGQEAANT